MTPRQLTEAELEQKRRNVAAIAKSRREAARCSKGHSNWRVRSDGRRFCRTCRQDNQAAWRTIVLIAMSKDKDHRYHGTYSGYSVGCRCFKCRLAGYKYHKGKRDSS